MSNDPTDDKQKWAEEFAASEADILLRERHPEEWQELYDRALKKRAWADKPEEKSP